VRGPDTAAHMTSCNPHAPASAFAGAEACNDPRCDSPAPATARCLLLVTHLAPGVGAVVVADIFKRCRERHGQLAITGTMLFDGERFGVLCCGAPDQVSLAAEAITSDPRQARPMVLADASRVPAWAARTWHSGWCEPDALALLTAADAPQGPDAVNAWRALLAASDLL
jgi:hypothetical protein